MQLLNHVYMFQFERINFFIILWCLRYMYLIIDFIIDP